MEVKVPIEVKVPQAPLQYDEALVLGVTFYQTPHNSALRVYKQQEGKPDSFEGLVRTGGKVL